MVKNTIFQLNVYRTNPDTASQLEQVFAVSSLWSEEIDHREWMIWTWPTIGVYSEGIFWLEHMRCTLADNCDTMSRRNSCTELRVKLNMIITGNYVWRIHKISFQPRLQYFQVSCLTEFRYIKSQVFTLPSTSQFTLIQYYVQCEHI